MMSENFLIEEKNSTTRKKLREQIVPEKGDRILYHNTHSVHCILMQGLRITLMVGVSLFALYKKFLAKSVLLLNTISSSLFQNLQQKISQ